MTTEELLEQLKTRELVVFGAGFVAEMFCTALEMHGLEDRLQACIVSRALPGQCFHGRPVCSLNEVRLPESALLCVAVHDSAGAGLQEALNPYEAQTVWIYPHLFELLYGRPLRFERSLPLSELLSRQNREEYWLAVRYAALREVLENGECNPETLTLYQRAMSLHCGEDTARKRAILMGELARSMREVGFREDCPIRIDEAGHILDGLHRVACAACLRLEAVPALVYPESQVFDRVLGERNRLPERVLRGTGFSSAELELIQGAQTELFRSTSVRAPEVSVILPVYNVGEYLDVCMESLERQTFRDFEMLLINDGSTDDSPERCRRWAEHDRRIRYIEKENEGVAATRNLGVRLARGTYLAFIDPDDWVDPTYLENLHARLEETGADFAECDLWRYNNRTGERIYRSCGSRAGVPYTLREHMKYGPTATYKSMSRLSLWEKYDIRLPDCAFESPAIYALLLALSGRVESIPEALYYYRRFRDNSLIETGYAAKDGSANNTIGVEAMEFLLSEFKRCGIEEQYRDTLEGVVKYRLNDILAMQFHRKTEKDFRETVRNFRRFLEKTFPNGHNEPYITWGGYNLNRILMHMNWLHDPSCRFNFSSIVSVCGESERPAEPLSPLKHRNRYRQLMLERERNQTFWKTLEAVQPQYLFIDLIEERFDLIETSDRYLTKSDAYDGLTGGRVECRIIDRFSPECQEIWKKSIGEFVQRIRSIVPNVQFVIVESLLCEAVGNMVKREPFPQWEKIQKTNALLSEYYSYLEALTPEAVVVRPSEDPLWFTDRRFEYGAVPSHGNEILNQRLAEKLERVL